MTEPAQPPAGVRVVVLDDDPTGTQCTSEVDVALDPAAPDIVESQALYVLTNTRAVSAQTASRIVSRVRDSFDNERTVFVLRGDSTLRGHVAAEMMAFRLAERVGLIVPAYPAAGRVTIGGVHQLVTADGYRNVADTEFAHDPVFGFTARTMVAWAAEVGLCGPVVPVRAEQLRAGGADAVRDALVRAPDGAMVVPDAETDNDIQDIARGFWSARAVGRDVVVRSAAPLAAAIAGRPGRLLKPSVEAAARVLVVCGSHTSAATRQLAMLAGADRSVRTLATAAAIRSDRQNGGLVDKLREDLDRDGLALVATERERLAEHGTLRHAAAVMAALMSVVRELADEVDAVVSKGGITSAEVATIGLGGRVARVRGQICTGVSVWDVRSRSGRVVPQAIVPGNLGPDGTLVDVVAFFGVGRPGIP